MTTFSVGDRVYHYKSGRAGVILEFGVHGKDVGRVKVQWADGETHWRWLSVMVSWGAQAFLAALSVGT